ncbi:MAG: hypothetical protein HY578_00610 [Nitrospinae bacterium]|nr:hypothetical protein [Candidatus Omnitrophota bacterium]MBI4377578.1 hypothetical protein [Nitrospinota bacterium]
MNGRIKLELKENAVPKQELGNEGEGAGAWEREEGSPLVANPELDSGNAFPNWSLGTRVKGAGAWERGHEKQSVGRSRQPVLMSRFHSCVDLLNLAGSQT